MVRFERIPLPLLRLPGRIMIVYSDCGSSLTFGWIWEREEDWCTWWEKQDSFNLWNFFDHRFSSRSHDPTSSEIYAVFQEQDNLIQMISCLCWLSLKHLLDASGNWLLQSYVGWISLSPFTETFSLQEFPMDFNYNSIYTSKPQRNKEERKATEFPLISSSGPIPTFQLLSSSFYCLIIFLPQIWFEKLYSSKDWEFTNLVERWKEWEETEKSATRS